MLLSALIGSGIQLFSMVIYTIIIAMIAFITPEHRGAMLMSMIFIFVFMGVFAGYFAARFYKMFGGREWLKMSLLTAFLYPSLLFAVFLIINIMFWMERSSAGVFY
jgi:transmembrane 9 superfamily protein 2/4